MFQCKNIGECYFPMTYINSPHSTHIMVFITGKQLRSAGAAWQGKQASDSGLAVCTQQPAGAQHVGTGSPSSGPSLATCMHALCKHAAGQPSTQLATHRSPGAPLLLLLPPLSWLPPARPARLASRGWSPGFTAGAQVRITSSSARGEECPPRSTAFTTAGRGRAGACQLAVSIAAGATEGAGQALQLAAASAQRGGEHSQAVSAARPCSCFRLAGLGVTSGGSAMPVPRSTCSAARGQASARGKRMVVENGWTTDHSRAGMIAMLGFTERVAPGPHVQSNDATKQRRRGKALLSRTCCVRGLSLGMASSSGCRPGRWWHSASFCGQGRGRRVGSASVGMAGADGRRTSLLPTQESC